MYQRLLVPVDGSEHALRAMQSAKDLVSTMKSQNIELTLLHINPQLSYTEPPLGVDVDSRLEDEGEQLMAPAYAILEGISAQIKKVTRHGDPAQLICKEAQDGNIDLIIMGTRGMGLMSEVFLGSVSHDVIQQAVCPVMVVK
ncbi:nucleotide-binding universal stress UspA family protein [Paenibacillus shirakamiensis]|uniref:Nucleotide-binding universal stress UspA family protein n=1 Tax=Paenibacillus shirakamiensis TaxID=1265935 RepID=A0ABS4JHM7_9BACL|nr:universal stress protein [Paenibacillus shirakamiensis]MBP2001228.1 nucleotide-binding universal stress UspA family protein [Paenibacillus shirakamiensis]